MGEFREATCQTPHSVIELDEVSVDFQLDVAERLIKYGRMVVARGYIHNSLGNIVTTPRSDMMYVVTEYGIVNLKGMSVADRAKALISIAHPDYRESLEREARENALIPRGYK